jgi:hypothetical protein
VLAPAEQGPRRVEEPRKAEIVVAVDGGPDAADAVRTGHRIGHHLGTAYPGRSAVVLLLSESANEPAAPADAPPVAGGVPVLAWSHPGQSALEATLRAVESFDAAAGALVAPEAEDASGPTAGQMLGHVLVEGVDLACPYYTTHPFDGVVSTGIVYPVLRALFGKRLRQPIAREMAISRRLAAQLLGEAWVADPTRAGDRLWLVGAVLAQDVPLCQVYRGAPPPRVAEANSDLAASLAHVVGTLFHEMRVHAPAWQRVKGSRPVKTVGEPVPPAGDGRQPQIAPMVSAFQLGFKELDRLWGAVLPPQTLLALKRLAAMPEEAFGMDDVLWARIVYDFAVGYHLATMDRALLLRSITPLYLGWAASFVREVRDLDWVAAEARIERLCRAFEAAKPHLISRWRWPDRFNP